MTSSQCHSYTHSDFIDAHLPTHFITLSPQLNVASCVMLVQPGWLNHLVHPTQGLEETPNSCPVLLPHPPVNKHYLSLLLGSWPEQHHQYWLEGAHPLGWPLGQVLHRERGGVAPRRGWITGQFAVLAHVSLPCLHLCNS